MTAGPAHGPLETDMKRFQVELTVTRQVSVVVDAEFASDAKADAIEQAKDGSWDYEHTCEAEVWGCVEMDPEDR